MKRSADFDLWAHGRTLQSMKSPLYRTRALLRSRDIVSPYPEGVSIGETDRLASKALAVLLEAVELAKELRGKPTDRRWIWGPAIAFGEVETCHGREDEVSGVLLLDDLNGLIAEEIFDPCLPMIYHKKGRLSVEAATERVLQAAETHGATGVIVFHLAHHGYSSAGEADRLIPLLRKAAELRGLRLLDYLAIFPPRFESMRGGPLWNRP
jgi:hypothetical protein